MSASPVGELIPNHPWEERTGRKYYQDEGGAAFNLNDKIITGGAMYVKHSARRISYQKGERIVGPVEYFWEHVPNPVAPERARRLD